MESGFLTTNVISHFSQHWREVGHSISVMSLTHELFARKTKRPGLSLSPGTSVDQPSPKCCSRTTVGGTLGIVNGSSVLRPGTRGETVGMTRGSQRPRPARPTSTDKGGAPLSLADGVKFSCAIQNAPRLDLSPGRLLISPPPSAAREPLYSGRPER